MEEIQPAFARDAATAVYYDRRAAEYDEWYEDRGQFARRDRPGWREEVAALVTLVGDLAPASTLDVACGTGFLTRHLRGAVTGIDRSREMVRVAGGRLPGGAVLTGDALALPVRSGSLARVVTAHFYGHLPPSERAAFLAEAARVAGELIVIDSAWRPGVEAEQWQQRVLNDGSRHRVYKRYLRPDQLAAEIGGQVLWSGQWFVAAGAKARSLAGGAIEQLAYGVGVPGMAARLVDQVQEDPAQIGAVPGSARLAERRHGPDGGVGAGGSGPIGGQGILE